MEHQDKFQRFLFEGMGVRGEMVSLDQSWQSISANRDYPNAVKTQLGQGLAAVVLLTGTIKFNGSLILQVQSTGPMTALVAQATNNKSIRGLARWSGIVPSGTLSDVYGDGRLILTIETEGNDPYQGIVALKGRNLADALQSYFSESEQLRTGIWLAANEHRAVGLLIQEMPSQVQQDDDWNRVKLLAETVTDRELLELSGETLLYRLFNEEQVRLFEAVPVVFRCRCSSQLIENTLVALGRAEIDSILQERGVVDVDCEFCNRHYCFDSVDIGRVFAKTSAIKSPMRSQ